MAQCLSLVTYSIFPHPVERVACNMVRKPRRLFMHTPNRSLPVHRRGRVLSRASFCIGERVTVEIDASDQGMNACLRYHSIVNQMWVNDRGNINGHEFWTFENRLFFLSLPVWATVQCRSRVYLRVSWDDWGRALKPRTRDSNQLTRLKLHF